MEDSYDSLTDEFGDVSVVAKYDEMKEIIRELICMGYDIASLEIHKEEFEEYWDEYILSITKESGTPVIWCEKFKREKGYITDDSSITYVMDNCSSKVIPNIKSKIQFEVSIGEDDDESNCGDCDCKSDCKEYSGTDEDGNTFNISIKGDLDLDEAYAKLDEMEVRMLHMSEMFDEMNNFSRLLGCRI